MSPKDANVLELNVTPVGGDRPGAEIRGLDARTAGAAEVDALQYALAEHGVVVLRDQHLPPADYVRFAKLFGELEPATREQFWLGDQHEIYVISNVVENGRPLGNPDDGFFWHTDGYYWERPTSYTFLYGVETPPEGADTQFCSTRRLYESLPEERRRRFDGMQVVGSHNRLYAGRLTEEQMRATPDVVHPLVRTHPLTGEKSLYFTAKRTSAPIGLTEEEGGALIDELMAGSSAPENVYSHKWRPRDLVIWDNRGLLHTATDYDKQRYRRIMHRLSVRGERPV